MAATRHARGDEDFSNKVVPFIPTLLKFNEQ